MTRRHVLRSAPFKLALFILVLSVLAWAIARVSVNRSLSVSPLPPRRGEGGGGKRGRPTAPREQRKDWTEKEVVRTRSNQQGRAEAGPAQRQETTTKLKPGGKRHMKRKTMTTGLLAMGIVIALATLGLVIGNWAQSLSINGNVQTGSLDVVIDSKIAEDNEDNAVKDVGTCAISGLQGKKVTVEITNAYPGYQCHIWNNIVNKGSLAVATSATVDNPNPQAVTLQRSPDIDAGQPGGKKGDCENANLHGGETEFCDWDVIVTKGADQDTKYTFTINISATLP